MHSARFDPGIVEIISIATLGGRMQPEAYRVAGWGNIAGIFYLNCAETITLERPRGLTPATSLRGHEPESG